MLLVGEFPGLVVGQVRPWRGERMSHHQSPLVPLKGEVREEKYQTPDSMAISVRVCLLKQLRGSRRVMV